MHTKYNVFIYTSTLAVDEVNVAIKLILIKLLSFSKNKH